MKYYAFIMNWTNFLTSDENYFFFIYGNRKSLNTSCLQWSNCTANEETWTWNNKRSANNFLKERQINLDQIKIYNQKINFWLLWRNCDLRLVALVTDFSHRFVVSCDLCNQIFYSWVRDTPPIVLLFSPNE